MTKLGLGKVRALFPIIPSYQKRLCQLLLTQPLVLYILEPHARLKKIQEDSRRFKNILKDNPYIISTLRFTKAVRAAPLSRPFCSRARSTNWLTAG